jgi:hypothetical protein
MLAHLAHNWHMLIGLMRYEMVQIGITKNQYKVIFSREQKKIPLFTRGILASG